MDPIELWHGLRDGVIGTLVDSGPSWALRVFQDGDRVEYALVTPLGRHGGWTTPGSADVNGAWIHWGGTTGPGRPFYLVGAASRVVQRLVAHLDDGSSLEIRPAGSELGFPNVYFAAELPLGRRAVTIDVLDAAGNVLERVDTSASLEV